MSGQAQQVYLQMGCEALVGQLRPVDVRFTLSKGRRIPRIGDRGQCTSSPRAKPPGRCSVGCSCARITQLYSGAATLQPATWPGLDGRVRPIRELRKKKV